MAGIKAPLNLAEFWHSFPCCSSPVSFSFLRSNPSSTCAGFGGAASFVCNSLTTAFSYPSSISLLCKNITAVRPPSPSSQLFTFSTGKQICRAAEYKFPDPIPEFAESETEKFRTHLYTKLSRKSIFGDSIEEVVEVCSEIFNTFLHTEYGGPGTLLVIPFIDMADTLKERGLPGAPQAARAAVVWAQEHVDKDWNEWTGENTNQ